MWGGLVGVGGKGTCSHVRNLTFLFPFFGSSSSFSFVLEFSPWGSLGRETASILEREREFYSLGLGFRFMDASSSQPLTFYDFLDRMRNPASLDLVRSIKRWRKCILFLCIFIFLYLCVWFLRKCQEKQRKEKRIFFCFFFFLFSFYFSVSILPVSWIDLNWRSFFEE